MVNKNQTTLEGCASSHEGTEGLNNNKVRKSMRLGPNAFLKAKALLLF